MHACSKGHTTMLVGFAFGMAHLRSSVSLLTNPHQVFGEGACCRQDGRRSSTGSGNYTTYPNPKMLIIVEKSFY